MGERRETSALGDLNRTWRLTSCKKREQKAPGHGGLTECMDAAGAGLGSVLDIPSVLWGKSGPGVRVSAYGTKQADTNFPFNISSMCFILFHHKVRLFGLFPS